MEFSGKKEVKELLKKQKGGKRAIKKSKKEHKIDNFSCFFIFLHQKTTIINI